MSKITPCLWFDGQAEDAARLYVSVFKNSTLGAISRYGDAGPLPKGTIMTVAFELDGQPMLALNGGPQYRFTEAVSFQVACETQAEVDHFWGKLCDGGEEGPCGWLKDRFGLSWQIVPTALPQLIGGADADKTKRVTEAMFQMRKLDIAALERAGEAGQTS
jgi:predicted 3-demethylubiquinone-9 3-methyltransferase (glyoxalase superfamily)